jgi:hypothetical protein
MINIVVDYKKLKLYILSHPDYPSLYAYFDSLNSVGINSNVIKVPKENIKELPKVFIAVLNYNKFDIGIFCVKNIDNKYLISNDVIDVIIDEIELFKIWSDVVLFIDTDQNNIYKSKITDYLFISEQFLLLPLIIGIVRCVLFYMPIVYFVHLILSIVGSIFCFQIIKHEFGIQYYFIKKFCSITKRSSCDAVLGSPAAKLFGKVGLGDIGVVFFSSFIVSWLFVASNAATWIFLASMAAMPFTLFSLWYQWFRVKKWCPLCLCVVLTLWLMLAPSIFSLQHASAESWSVWGLLQFASIFTLAAFVWAWIKSLLPLMSQVDELERDDLSFRRNYHLFLPYFYKQLPVDVAELEGDIFLGNKNAPVELLAITNPMCSTCITSHFMYEELLKKYPSELRLRLRFVVPFTNRKDPRTLVAEKMIELFETLPEEEFRQSLHDWYLAPLKSWLDKRGKCSNSDYYNKILENQRVWCQKYDVQTTPTMFINGRLFPKFYHPTDLRFMIDEIVEKELKNRSSEILEKDALVCNAR